MRVAFCGASGTGKSTLVNALSDLALPFCPIGSRDVSAAMGFASPYDVDAAGRRDEFQRKLLELKSNWELSRERFITDRTHVDNLCYSILHGMKIDADFMSAVGAATSRYTHIFFCPISAFFDPADDPQRVHDPVYHRNFEMSLMAYLPTYVSPTCRVSIVTARDLPSRMHQVRAALF